MADEYYIQAQLRSQEAQIGELQRQRAMLEQRLAELRQLEVRFGNTQVQFNTRQHARRVALAGVAGKTAASRTAQRYQQGMSSLLEGSRYMQVASGLNAGMDRIQQEIRNVESQIGSLNAQIAQGQARANQLESQYWQARRDRLAREG